jgi:predicted Zn-dependent protease
LNSIRRRINRFFRTYPLAVFCFLGCVFLLFTSPSASIVLPAAQIHRLPSTLAQWKDSENHGDYFDRVQKTTPDYLVWSEFPVKVYIDPVHQQETLSNELEAIHPSRQSGQIWVDAVQKAVQEWSMYLPLQVVNQLQEADIRIIRSAPPLQFPLTQRARSAETRFELYSQGSPAILFHRCSIFIKPSQADIYLLAAARHELGHALGIWGHSPVETDTMYFSQVREPAPISDRDINTLKRVYEQPTRLGWEIPKA